MTFHKVWMLWLKKWACHTLGKFKIVLAGNPFWVHLKTSNLVKSCNLIRLKTGKNLVVISQFSVEWFKYYWFFHSYFSPLMRGHLMRRLKYEWKNQSFSYYSTLNWDITTKFLPVIKLIRLQLFTKFEIFWCTQNGLPAKTILNFPRAWQAHFLSQNIQTLWKVIFSKDV